jgi:hypothetical protein
MLAEMDSVKHVEEMKNLKSRQSASEGDSGTRVRNASANVSSKRLTTRRFGALETEDGSFIAP